MDLPAAPKRRIRTLLADDHTLVRSGLKLILGAHSDIEVVGEASSAAEAIGAVFALRPDVTVMDVALGSTTGVEATRRIMQEIPESRVLIVSMHSDPIYVREALRAGARGYVLKDAIDTEFVTAVRAVARGEGMLSAGISGTVLDDYRTFVRQPVDLLTGRERQILELLAGGYTAKDVATELAISPYTVDAHRSRILKKLQLRGSTDLVRFAIENGLIQVRTT
jgi:two-component system response regulator NreC